MEFFLIAYLLLSLTQLNRLLLTMKEPAAQLVEKSGFTLNYKKAYVIFVILGILLEPISCFYYWLKNGLFYTPEKK